MAVAGVFAEADVGDEHELLGGCGLLEGAQSLLHDAVVVPRAGALLVLGFGQAKKQQAAESEASGFFGFAHGFVDGEIEDAGHGADGAAHALAGTEKERVDQVAGIKRGLANQGAKRLCATQAPNAGFRETHRFDCMTVVSGQRIGTGTREQWSGLS